MTHAEICLTTRGSGRVSGHRPGGPHRPRGLTLSGVTLVAVLTVACGDSPNPDDPRAASTIRMAQILDSVATEAEQEAFEYVNTARLQQLRTREVPSDLSSQSIHRYELADEMLRTGDNAEAVDTLISLYARLEGQEGVPEPFVAAVEDLLGLAYLRIAETENCVLDPGSGMCLFPISLESVYRKEAGSRGAIEWYGRVLERDPTNLTARWLLNVAYMTVGEHPGRVPEQWVIPTATFRAEAEMPAFPEIAKRVGVATMGLAGGGIAEDFDGDGDLDLFATSWGIRDQVVYLENQGEAGFADVTLRAGLEGITGGLQAMQTDFDNDGFADVFILRGAWLPMGHPNSLLRNRGDGTFEDVTIAAGLYDMRSSQTAIWADFDNDGQVDVMIGNEASYGRRDPVQLFWNRGDGTFEEVGARVGADVSGFIKGITSGDYDNDGWADVYISRLGESNVLLRNRTIDNAGELSFADVTSDAGVSEPIASFPTWFFDFDEDGFDDLWVSGYEATAGDLAAEYMGLEHAAEMPRLYRNRGDGTFEDVTVQMGMDRVLLTMGSNYGDLNNDGFLDLYAGTGDPDFRSLMPNRMFMNDSGSQFLDVTTSGGFGHLQKGHGVAFADLDNDGDQDVFAVMGGAFEGDAFHNALFANPGTEGAHWLTLRLAGVQSNRAAIGARVRLHLVAPDGSRRTLHRTVGSGGSFGASPLQVQMGLGDASEIDFLEVYWPASGAVDRIDDVQMDRVYRFVESSAVLEEVSVTRFDLMTVVRPN